MCTLECTVEGLGYVHLTPLTLPQWSGGSLTSNSSHGDFAYISVTLKPPIMVASVAAPWTVK